MKTPNSLIMNNFDLNSWLPFRLGKDLAEVLRKTNPTLHWLLPTGQ